MILSTMIGEPYLVSPLAVHSMSIQSATADLTLLALPVPRSAIRKTIQHASFSASVLLIYELLPERQRRHRLNPTPTQIEHLVRVLCRQYAPRTPSVLPIPSRQTLRGKGLAPELLQLFLGLKSKLCHRLPASEDSVQ